MDNDKHSFVLDQSMYQSKPRPLFAQDNENESLFSVGSAMSVYRGIGA